MSRERRAVVGARFIAPAGIMNHAGEGFAVELERAQCELFWHDNAGEHMKDLGFMKASRIGTSGISKVRVFVCA